MTRVSGLLFWSVMTLIVSMGLYHTSYRVDRLARTLTTLNARLESERLAIHVLKAEWVYLSNPSRVETAVRKHLDLEPMRVEQIARLDKLPGILLARREKDKQIHPIASLDQRIATYAPRASSQETGRLNTHVAFSQSSPSTASRPAWRMAGDTLPGLRRVGDAP